MRRGLIGRRRRRGRSRALALAALALLASPQRAGALLPQSPQPDAAIGARTLRVRDAALAAEIRSRGGRLIADYGSFQLLELAGPAAAELAAAPGVEVVDEFRYVLLRAGAIDTSGAAARAQLGTPVESFDGRRLHLVQLAGPTRPEWYRALTDTGVEVVSYIPHNAYLVYGDQASLEALRGLTRDSGFVRWDGPYADDHKLQPRAGTRARRGRGEPAAATGLYAVQLVSDAPANAATLQAVEGLRRGAIRSRYEVLGLVNLIVPLDAAGAQALAARPDVVSIQPFATPRLSGERQSLIVAGDVGGVTPGPGYLSHLAAWGFTQQQFTASAFAVDVSDSGVDDGTTTPNHFGLYAGGVLGGASRVAYARLEGQPIFGDTIEGCDGHGTINAHIIAGYDDQSGFPHTDAAGFHYGLGVAPFVRVGSSVIFAPDYIFPDFTGLHSRAYRDGARISSNSWGGLVSGAYDAQAQLFDALTRDAQPAGAAVSAAGNQEMVMVVASGNEGPVALRSPGTAKNVITVGASENVQAFSGADGCGVPDAGADSADDMTGFSSGGPTADQRHKPDLVAPGTHVSGGVFQTPSPGPTGQADSCFDGTGTCGGVGSPFFPAGQEFYTASSGTSHSTPAVAGGAALLRQHFINQGLAPPSPAMTKAYLMASTRYLTGARAGDDLWSDDQGMGALDLGVAFDTAARILRDQVPSETFTASGQTRTLTGIVADPGLPFRVTLAWTDAPGSTTGDAFNNDLDLTVTVGGVTYAGNVFSGALSVPGGSPDRRNNAESVFLPAGTAGEFAVTVTAANIDSDGVPNVGGALDQDYALVVYDGDEVPLPVLAAAGASLAEETCGAGNGAIDPGELVTVDLGVANIGLGDAADVVGMLQATGGVSSPSGPQSYGSLDAGGPAVARPFSFVAQGTCGGVLTATLSLHDGGVDLGSVSFDFDLGVLVPGGPATGFSNPSNIVIDLSGPAAPYPSGIAVAGLPGKVSKVTATLHGVSHPFPEDIDALLVAPDGSAVVLMSDAGGGGGVSGVTLTFDDDASALLPDGGSITSGTYRPTNWGAGVDDFPSPAPPGRGSTLAELAGGSPNGIWSLYVVDDFFLDGGSISGGWSLSIETSTPVCCDSGPVAEPVVWTDAAGVLVSGSSLEKTAPTGWGDAGAASVQRIPSGDGFFEFTASEVGTHRAAGLSWGDSDLRLRDIDFAVYLHADGALRIYEKGVSRGSFGPYTAGDRIRVGVESGAVVYRRNGVPLYASAVLPNYPLLVDAAFYTIHATLTDAVIGGSGPVPPPPPPPAGAEAIAWTDGVGVLASGSRLEKTAATGWGDAGAVSAQQIPSGAGFLEVTATENDTHRVVGLSWGNTDQRLNDVDFGLYLHGDGTLRVVEGGTFRGNFGPYLAGDRLRVAVDAGAVSYSRNGVVFYASSALSNYPLLADAALYTEHATLGDAYIGGSGPVPPPPPPPAGAEAVVWTGSGVLVAGNSLEKIAPTAWGNAGAVSAQSIPGDGFVEFAASENDTHRVMGLSAGDSDLRLSDVDFGIYLHGDGTLRIVENGTFRGNFGPYLAGDRLRVAVAAGAVSYSRNGAVLFTSGVPATQPMIVDSALYDQHATLSDAWVEGATP